MNSIFELTALPAHIRKFHYILFACLFVFTCPFTPCAFSADSHVDYKVQIKGIPGNDLQKDIESSSDTFSLKKMPPASLNMLEKRINHDIPRILSVLRSHGYYNAKIDHEIDINTDPVNVTFNIDRGSPYIIKNIEIHITDEAESLNIKLPSEKELGLRLSSPAESKRIFDAQELLEQWFLNRGFPFAVIEIPEIIVDHADQSALVNFYADPGPMALFGPALIEGLLSVEESFVRSKIIWLENDIFDEKLISGTRDRLYDTGLFSSVEVLNDEHVENDRVSIHIKLKERKHRTVKAGISYKTDERTGGKIAWEHRNLFGKGENFKVTGLASDIAYSIESGFQKPEFLKRPDQTLILNFRIAEDHPDAYTSKNISSSAKIEKAFLNKILIGGGLGLKTSKIKAEGQDEQFNLISLPVSLERDTREDLLDPDSGGYLNIQATPFHAVFDSGLFFTKGYLGYSHYLRLSRDPGLVLAARSSLGSITGADLKDIPADIRFYAGGGGSVRGYPFQSAGPLKGGVPSGGKSLFEISAELRARLSEDIGIALFLDGGSACESALPDFNETMRWGTGIGLRYFTPIGPLRIDAGFPLNRRNQIDESFQLYLSLGQAF